MYLLHMYYTEHISRERVFDDDYWVQKPIDLASSLSFPDLIHVRYGLLARCGSSKNAVVQGNLRVGFLKALGFLHCMS